MPELKNNCVDCNSEFVITEEEQVFFKSKNFDLPKRCKPCRRRRKLERQERKEE